jgi:hypothetical protein
MIYKHYENGDILPGRYAEQIDDETFKIVKQDKTTMDVRIGEVIPKVGTVSLDHNSNLKIGKLTIIVGTDPHTEYSAFRTTSKKKFTVKCNDGKEREGLVNEYVPGLGKLTQDQHGRIYLEGRNIPIFQKKYELNVIGMQEKDGGIEAYINKLIPKDPENGKNGIQGIFVVGKNGNPCIFQEKGTDGRYYATAQFKANPDGKSMSVKMRSLQSAIEDKYISQELERIKTNEADPYGEDPMNIQEYSELKTKLIELRSTSFSMMEFGVLKGHRLLDLPRPKAKDLSPQP